MAMIAATAVAAKENGFHDSIISKGEMRINERAKKPKQNKNQNTYLRMHTPATTSTEKKTTKKLTKNAVKFTFGMI